MNWLLPDQKKLALSRAYGDLPITFGGVPHLVVIEQQCFERVRNAASLVSDDFLTRALDESERIASARVQTNDVNMHMHVRPVSGQTTEQRSIGMLTRSFTTKKNPPPGSDATAVPLHPMSGTPP